MSEILYRLGTEADFPLVAPMYGLLDEAFRHMGYLLPKPANVEQAWLDSFRRTLGRFSNLFIAEMEGEVVGFMLARVKSLPAYRGGVLVGELSDMWIVEKARRRGIGDELSKRALAWLRESGTHSVEIQVLVGNEASWKLYERMGFQMELRQARLVWGEENLD